jgi:uroporphyrinogen decarboxylase
MENKFQMNSRERVLKTIQHQEPDRIPIDLGSTIVTGISATKYHELKQYLGFRINHTRIFDVYLMLAQIDLEVLDQLAVDTIMVPWLMRRDRWGIRLDNWKSWEHPKGFTAEVPSNFSPDIMPDGTLLMIKDGRVFAKMPPSGFYFDYLENERRIGDNLPDTEKARYALLTDEELEFIQSTAKFLFDETDKALVGDAGGQDLDIVGSYDEWLMLLAAEKEYMSEFYTKRAESVIENLKLYHQAVGELIQVIFFGQDFGMQDRELLSPRTFKEIIFSPYKQIFDWIHKNTTWKVMFHSDGSLVNILPLMIEMGIDILNPVQCTAAGMNPSYLKSTFGDRLVFWGAGVDTQDVLPYGTVDQVREQVYQRISVFAPEGGYIFSPVHNIQDDVPVENIIAAYEAAKESGFYSDLA